MVDAVTATQATPSSSHKQDQALVMPNKQRSMPSWDGRERRSGKERRQHDEPRLGAYEMRIAQRRADSSHQPHLDIDA
ncbi:hypothetical protein [Agaribacterium sp. ZY112]|uniref:hypothetical protein n=1 Tax=Agaribacterium sp. ZY112 TaxID=3233574 RepID=UPI00352653FC